MTKILIIDDEPLVRIALRSLENWEQEGIEIIGETSNGVEALEFLAAHPETDIVVVDVDMPLMNGLELAEHVQKTNLGIHMLFLSSFDSFQYARRAFKAGAQDYILKTEMDQGRLLSLIKKVQASSGIIDAGPSVLEKKRMELLSLLSGDSRQPNLLASMKFPLTLVILRPVDEAQVNKRYAEQSESIMRLTVDLLRQCCVACKDFEVFALSINRYMVLLADNEDCTYVMGEFLRSSTVYLDLMFEYRVASRLGSWSEVQAQYQAIESNFAPVSRMVLRARRFIQEQYADASVDLPTIAKAVQVSKNHLSSEFRKETGQSLSFYLSSVRIERAIQLLEQTNLLTYEVAEAVGFKNTETFTRMFKKVTGKTPRSYH